MKSILIWRKEVEQTYKTKVGWTGALRLSVKLNLPLRKRETLSWNFFLLTMCFEAILHAYYFYIHILCPDVIYIYLYLFHLSFVFTFFLCFIYLYQGVFHIFLNRLSLLYNLIQEFEINFCACSQPALGLLVVYNDENHWKLFHLETKLALVSFYSPWTHQQNPTFSEIFRGYK